MNLLADRPPAAVPLAGVGFFPGRASSVAGGIDDVFGLIFWVSAFFLLLIVTLTVLFAARYRARPSRPAPDPSPDHDDRLELLWSAIPLVLVFVIFGVATRTYLRMTEPDPGSSPMRVQVTGRRWSWWFDHPSGKGAKDLHLVAGRTTELVLASTDVVHSLYVPEFRLKQDAVPGRFTKMVFTPILAGSFPILCTEYCGTNHSQMLSTAVVHPDQASFDAWATEGAGLELSLVDLGKRVLDEKGCTACHSVDGEAGLGPTFKGMWGKTEKLVDGSSVLVDENYVRESIVKPGVKLVAGYDDIMPAVPLEDREMQGAILYLESLKGGP